MSAAVTEKSQVTFMEKLRAYVFIARPDHWVKHVFILPGIVFCYLLDKQADLSLEKIFFGFVSACLVASANYVINEWLDAEFDQFHPTKSLRPAVTQKLDPRIVYLEYGILFALSLWLSAKVNKPFLYATALLGIMGILYNVNPLRTKDRFVLDVLSESLNNPIRLMLGWFMVSEFSVPPVSIVLAYWFAGAFLMSSKRLAEYKHILSINQLENLHRYRRSFQSYSEQSLISLTVLYAIVSTFFLAVFLVKYRAEYIFLFPLIAIFFTYYFTISMKKALLVQAPEKLFSDRNIVLLSGAVVIVFVLSSKFDMPILSNILSSRAISIEQLIESLNR